VPGSKSITNRALILAALAAGQSYLRNPLRSRDTELMAAGLRALGAVVEVDGADWVVTSGPRRVPAQTIDVGNAGTVARFLPPVAALAPGPVRFDGDSRMRERPLAPLVHALQGLGVDVTASDSGGLPVTVNGRGSVRGGAVAVDASASSQLISGLLLAGPAYDEGVAVSHHGSAVPSQPHLAMTVAMLRDSGAQVETDGATMWQVQPGALGAREWVIEPDLSSAAPFLAAAAVTAGTVRIPGWPSATTQPGGRLPALLTAMGATTRLDSDALVVSGPDALTGIDADMHDCGELVPVLTAVAVLATTPSRLTGVAHLRQHETDRLAALVREINQLGGEATETTDGIDITPRTLHGGTFATYDDHRMAMAGAVIGLVVGNVELDDVATTVKTLPDFAGLWSDMLEQSEAGS
jgi:3-phosphoshikimate 1-carboxyvinyltransferase